MFVVIDIFSNSADNHDADADDDCVLKISVVTMLALLLTSENLTFIGKMIFMFNNIVDCTVLISDKNEDTFVELHDNL